MEQHIAVQHTCIWGLINQNSDKVEKYISRALAIKGNHRDAQVMMVNHLHQKLFNISNPDVLLDTIAQLDSRYDHEVIDPLLENHTFKAYLQIAGEAFSNNRVKEGNEYLVQFENECEPPVNDQLLRNYVENAYRSAAVYYFYRGQKTRAKSYVNRGLTYVSGSRLIQSAVY